MEKELWHKRYMARMCERAALTEEQAQDALQAGMDDFDYEEDPKDWADEGLSYWGED